MKIKKNMRGYVTLVVVIMFVPFLILQGINLVNMSVDVAHISTNSVAGNNQYVDEQTCWEEVLYFLRTETVVPVGGSINFSETECEFFVQDLGENRYRISLESYKDDFYSISERYIFYDNSVLKFIPSSLE